MNRDVDVLISNEHTVCCACVVLNARPIFHLYTHVNTYIPWRHTQRQLSTLSLCRCSAEMEEARTESLKVYDIV